MHFTVQAYVTGLMKKSTGDSVNVPHTTGLITNNHLQFRQVLHILSPFHWLGKMLKD